VAGEPSSGVGVGLVLRLPLDAQAASNDGPTTAVAAPMTLPVRNRRRVVWLVLSRDAKAGSKSLRMQGRPFPMKLRRPM
jgi:hypothetical protein